MYAKKSKEQLIKEYAEIGVDYNKFTKFGEMNVIVQSFAINKKDDVAKMEYFNFMPNWLSGAIFVPLIAQVWVIPIQMFYFNNISLYSVFANILTVPFLSVISFGRYICYYSIFINDRTWPICNQSCYYVDIYFAWKIN